MRFAVVAFMLVATYVIPANVALAETGLEGTVPVPPKTSDQLPSVKVVVVITTDQTLQVPKTDDIFKGPSGPLFGGHLGGTAEPTHSYDMFKQQH